MEGSFKKYYGTYGKHAGEGMVYYFLKDRDSNYLMNAILCALELRENMKKLSNEWKINKGWFNDLFMNIGINEGEEYFGTIPAVTVDRTYGASVIPSIMPVDCRTSPVTVPSGQQKIL